jgi:hypothetical protein
MYLFLKFWPEKLKNRYFLVKDKLLKLEMEWNIRIKRWHNSELEWGGPAFFRMRAALRSVGIEFPIVPEYDESSSQGINLSNTYDNTTNRPSGLQ